MDSLYLSIAFRQNERIEDRFWSQNEPIPAQLGIQSSVKIKLPQLLFLFFYCKRRSSGKWVSKGAKGGGLLSDLCLTFHFINGGLHRKRTKNAKQLLWSMLASQTGIWEDPYECRIRHFRYQNHDSGLPLRIFGSRERQNIVVSYPPEKKRWMKKLRGEHARPEMDIIADLMSQAWRSDN